MAQQNESETTRIATTLYEAVCAGDFEQVADALRKGSQEVLEVRHGYYKETPLLTATWNKKQRIVALLLQHKAKANAANHVGRTCLMHAAINDDLDSLGILLSHGADVHATDRCGMSALHFAAKSSPSGGTVKALIDAGANINAQCAASAYTWFFQSIDRDLQTHLFTPLHFAALACHADTVTLLMNNKARPRDKDGKGRTPLTLLLYHTQHFGAAYKDNYYKTRERLKRPYVEHPPAAEQVVKREHTPEPVVQQEPVDLKSIRRGLLRVRNDLVKDYEATNKSFKDERKDGKALKEAAKEFENQTNTRVAEATEYMNAAIEILKDADVTQPQDPYDDFAYYRVFTFIAKEVGGRKGQWQALAKALFETVEGVKTERVIKAVWAHSTTEVDAAHEVLVRWRAYSTDTPSTTIPRLKQVLEAMPVSKPFLINIDMLLNEKLPVREEKESKRRGARVTVGNQAKDRKVTPRMSPDKGHMKSYNTKKENEGGVSNNRTLGKEKRVKAAKQSPAGRLGNLR